MIHFPNDFFQVFFDHKMLAIEDLLPILDSGIESKQNEKSSSVNPFVNEDIVKLGDEKKDIRRKASVLQSLGTTATASLGRHFSSHSQSSVGLAKSEESLLPELMEKRKKISVLVDRIPGIHDVDPNAEKRSTPTLGSKWFDMKAIEITPEIQRDIQLLRMRQILDPKRFYKKERILASAPSAKSAKASGSKYPMKFFQVGTLVDGPSAGGFQSNVKKERNQNMLSALLEDHEARSYYKKKFMEMHHRKLENHFKNPKARNQKFKQVWKQVSK